LTARAATFGVFFVNGAAIGTWVGHIPWIQDRFELSKSTLGLVLLAMSIGVIVALPLMGQAIVRLGSVRATRLGGFACVALLLLPLLAPEPWLLPVALTLFGASSAAMDVSMNAHGVAVERGLHRPIMSSLHAGWAFGGLAGAGLVTVGGAAGLDPRLQTALAAALLAILLTASLRRIGPGSDTAEAPGGFVRPSRGVLLLAVLCLLIMVTEGAMADWGGLYLSRDLGTSTSVAALAFAAFSGGMTAGRLFGDWLNHRLGAATLMRGGTALAGVALGALLLVGEPAVALAGFFLVGIGVANGVPLVFSAAGHAPGRESGPNIAAVSSMGSIGFLAGPPFIGFLAEATSLPLALSTLCVGLAVVTLTARAAGAGDVRTPGLSEPAAAR
jgi:predicted MFS family arabinose efflux permease